MRLNESLMQDTNLGVQQIHEQLKNMCLEMQSLKQDGTTRPKVRAEVWCVNCKGQGHDKDHYPMFGNYLVGGGPMPLRPEVQVGPSVMPALWCAICQIG